MQITVYSGFSKRINSTKQPSGGQAINVVLKQPTSVINPHFVITGFDTSWNYIQWGNRYYFVDDIVILSNTQAEYSCSLDVLATYKSAIGASSQYVVRASGAYNPYVMDTKYPVLADSDLASVYLQNLDVDSTGIYVIGVVGGDATNTVTYYTLGVGGFANLMAALFNTSYLNASDISVELQKELVNPFQYIVSCYWFPFTATQVAGDMARIKFGWWDSGVYGGKLSDSQRVVSLEDTFDPPKHPLAATRGMYLNDAPFTRYTLNCYSFGSIPLNPSPFVDGDGGIIEIDVDLFTGLAQMYIACDASRMLTAISQFGVPIQINQNTANVVGGAISALSGVVDLALGQVVGGAAGIASAIQSIFPQVQSQGANGSKVAFMQIPNIVAEFRMIAEEDNATIGRPLCAVRTINTLSGFIQCENVDIDCNGTVAEKRAIIEFMEGGFFYE